MNARRSPRIVIVGAGVAGITAAHVLVERGYDDVVVLEKGSAAGGVWHWNAYPGLTCDVPSNLYQFGFAPKGDWERVFATGPQIKEYLNDVIDQLDLRKRIMLNAEVVSSIWDDGWRLTLADGRRIDADFVIMATGVLHHPRVPDIPGLDTFAGSLMHSARWDDTVQTRDRRVGVIGTGSTGVQLVTALQRQASHVVHFARTPQWVMWAPMDARSPRLLTALLTRSPRLRAGLYRLLLAGSGFLADIATKPTWRRRLVQRYARVSLTAQVRDRGRRSALTPADQPLCKRQVLSGGYYRAIASSNTTLVDSGISEVTSTGVTTVDGVHHELDVIVLATGFHAHRYMRPMELRGRDDVSIDDVWADGPRAYRMTAIPGFPNLFTVLGPHSPTGSVSLQYTAEKSAEYIAAWLDRYRDGELDTVEVTSEATDAFVAAANAAMESTVWATGCESWYLTPGGDVDLWPYDRAALTRMLGVPVDGHFLLTAPLTTPGASE